MHSAPVSPKIARAQAMEVVFGVSNHEMALLFPLSPSTLEGRTWEKRPREQQRAAMLWVLNRLFFATIWGLPLGDRDPQMRRTLLLDLCRERSSRLTENGWSMHEVMDWLLSIKEDRSWTLERWEV